MDMNFLDIVVLALVLLLGLKGLVRGLIKEVFGLLSIVGGVFLASRFADDMGAYIHTVFFPVENEGVRSLVGFVALFALIWTLLQLTATVIAKVVMVSGLGFMDKMGGMVVGAAKIFLVFSIIAYGFSNVAFIKDILESKFQNSIVYPLLIKTGSYIVNIDSFEIRQAKETFKAESEKLTGELAGGLVKNVEAEMNATLSRMAGETNASVGTRASEVLDAGGKNRD